MRLSVGVAAPGPHVLLEAAPPPGYVSKPHKPIGSLSRTLAELYLGLRWCSFKDLVAVHITLGEVPAARGRSQHRIPLLTSPTHCVASHASEGHTSCKGESHESSS